MPNVPRSTVTEDRDRPSPRHGPRHDVVIVGARAAGASTAMLLARAGVDVLVVDRADYGTDTLSSHALMRGAVDHLRRWGVLDRVAATTPAIHRSVFEFGGDRLVVDACGELNDPLYAPRRTVLDPLLVDAAREAGAEFCFGTRMVDLIRNRRGRVCGVQAETSEGRAIRVDADLVIGADGLRSAVARHVQAPVTRRGLHCLSSIYGYVRSADLAPDEYHFAYDGGLISGAIPTNESTHCVFVSMSPSTFRSGAQLDVAAALERTLAKVSPSIATGARAGSIVGPLRSFPGHPGQFRTPHGDGWALVGDAGYFKDPVAAHGLSDAFRDAELLTEAVLANDLAGYERVRDGLSTPLFDQIENFTALGWDAAGARNALVDFALAMAAESDALREHRDAVRAAVI
jgi:flavin-dependent dehydrogenase